ncbi:MAG: glycosyltransferase family 2 protein [Bacteroidales bacterium]|nr:glycosyltransferase family 2 protein [Bacteroidales bacterium]MDD3664927.1 glycosyltransferase family 2 protein [Bacteroidales bacterium]
MINTPSKSISIIIPAFNEAEGISILMNRFNEMALFDEFDIVVVDDGSTDNTSEVVAGFPVRLFRHEINKGYGAALKTGIRRALGEKVIFMDSDGQHDPSYLEKMTSMLLQYDMVIGDRTADSFQVKNRKAGKKVIKLVGEYLVEQKLPDYNSGFRGFDKDLIKGMLHLMPNGFSFSTTSTVAFLKEGYSIGTMPIKVSERVGRKSNVKFLKDGPKTFLLLFRLTMLFNPLKVFFPISVFLFIAGMAWGIFGYIHTSRFPNSATLVSMAGLFLFFIGLLADQISVMNRRKF